MLKSVEITGFLKIITVTQTTITTSYTQRKSVRVVSTELNAPNGAYKMNDSESGEAYQKAAEGNCVVSAM